MVQILALQQSQAVAAVLQENRAQTKVQKAKWSAKPAILGDTTKVQGQRAFANIVREVSTSRKAARGFVINARQGIIRPVIPP